jgi:hypothetical protein
MIGITGLFDINFYSIQQNFTGCIALQRKLSKACLDRREDGEAKVENTFQKAV